jgi:hypothetical protein
MSGCLNRGEATALPNLVQKKLALPVARFPEAPVLEILVGELFAELPLE